MTDDPALTRTTPASADWPFWLFLAVWACAILATLLWGGPILRGLETPLGWLGLIRSPTSSAPNGAIGALCFAWLALELLVLACLNLGAVLDNQRGRVLPALPGFLAHWLSVAQRSPRSARVVGWVIGLLPIALSLYIARVIFT
jgi:hypothetical protein